MQILNKSTRLIIIGDNEVMLLPTTITTVDDALLKKYPGIASMVKDGTELSEVDDLVGAPAAEVKK